MWKLTTPAQLNTKLQAHQAVLPTKAGKVTVKGSNANVSHTINEDERSEFTVHINGVGLFPDLYLFNTLNRPFQVLAGDADIGKRLPIPTDTMQLFDECRGQNLLDHAWNFLIFV